MRAVTSDSRIVRIGGWLFRYRTSLPIPLIAALLLVPPQQVAFPWFLDAAGLALVAGGELLRLWAVRHIGVISRTRSDRLGPVVATGPFAAVRNPLYLGNIAIWVGFALSAHIVWMAVVMLALLGLEYHAIVRWEEDLLVARRGDDYRQYAARVRRWIPRWDAGVGLPGSFSWGDTFFSERGTLIAIAVGYILLCVKQRI
jgi:protein-S-isoprenylcysteine O-methyltransferase Ste14